MAETLFSRTAFSISSGKLHRPSHLHLLGVCCVQEWPALSDLRQLGCLCWSLSSALLVCRVFWSCCLFLAVPLCLLGASCSVSAGLCLVVAEGSAVGPSRPLAFLLASCLLLRRGLPSFSAGCFGQDAVWAGSGIHRSGTHWLCSGSSGAVPRRSGASPAGPSPVSADCFVLGPFGGH